MRRSREQIKLTTPKLTLGIPTLDRPQFLHTCLRSLSAQTAPIRVVIGDQGWKESTRDVVEEFAGTLEIEHRRTRATSLWDNWVKTAEGCPTPYFAWVQDDDVVSPYYASRVLIAFDNNPLSTVWLARLACSYNTEGYACWWEGNGPPIPLDHLNYSQSEVNGDLPMTLAMFTSPALSPAIAFRVADGFDDMLESIPADCDLFHERMHIALWARGRRVVCDPFGVGYWVMHDGNISKQMNRNKEVQARHAHVLLEWIKPHLAAYDWLDVLDAWCHLVSPNALRSVVKTLNQKQMRGHKIAREALAVIRRLHPGLTSRTPSFT